MSQPESGEGAKPRILVAGASEILGRCIVAEFQQANWEVLGYGHSLAHPAKAASTTTQSFQFNVDFSDEKVARETIKQFKPCVIVHVPYERKLGEIDTDLTTALNVKATKFIAQEAVKIGAWVIYISSDWVYDGTTPPYRESDEPGPMNTYGQIKVDGENTLINVTRDSCILRVPLLYGCIESLEDSEITALMLLVLDVSNKHKLSHHEKYYAASAMDVARIVRRLCDKRLQDTCLRGIFHWSGHE
ncbi:PREDICTED: methionine adenosyltransferase 2 subunit beta-like, partial [Priapulus caudatus]|uniref:Methionine adenosyltransferase 2 subunit beta n=1 Tax=Priapulus caudatus TaxID=37621 RepID=A0ABM1DT48_PRICU